ncbi:hypothetical protein JZ751_028262 [Albula glossodonta]|uniref:Uncharacterized protein n=1 Tax=Albula glossodonta TaxID=121402 RepID=A0A8T2NCP2_9TELE|nr:hypothetical protein JZ751_028262 [Albula glossodonta]
MFENWNNVHICSDKDPTGRYVPSKQHKSVSRAHSEPTEALKKDTSDFTFIRNGLSSTCFGVHEAAPLYHSVRRDSLSRQGTPRITLAVSSVQGD